MRDQSWRTHCPLYRHCASVYIISSSFIIRVGESTLPLHSLPVVLPSSTKRTPFGFCPITNTPFRFRNFPLEPSWPFRILSHKWRFTIEDETVSSTTIITGTFYINLGFLYRLSSLTTHRFFDFRLWNY